MTNLVLRGGKKCMDCEGTGYRIVSLRQSLWRRLLLYPSPWRIEKCTVCDGEGRIGGLWMTPAPWPHWLRQMTKDPSSRLHGATEYRFDA